ncbi:DNA annealing helicase and endonuclease ZRANB3 [Micractinium conductrix]|uniref:DNA annealing helicase and endonuclease ZRANB3 n=1 Tax=Micractinium conductrix TaxID=554055 RepID=A0A2P6VMR8_9CHLO|nr:DNA annealing helicase and endonuclease ZRANB3 [Micractinium conductrix]|eukprot:PSC75396.1 DNA annealing helicase and endonuclease ZRANB3 [Micractinium conductrix]
MIPPATLKAAKGTLRTLPPPDAAAQRYARMPRFLEAALLPFQREGVRFGLARNGRCLIADEMGVGKTVQAVALASCYQEEWPLLVIAPASLRLVWAEEIEKWLPHLRPSCIHVIEGKEDRVARDSLPLVCITSYEMMQRLTCDACKGRGVQQQASMCAGQRPPCRDPHHCMACLQWRVVVVDESHTLRTSSKPPDALHTEAVVSAVKAARRAILLTGTPSLSRPFDLFRQVDAIMPGLLGRSRIEFAVAYCNRREVPLPGFHAPGQRGMRWDVSGLSRGAELHDLLKAEVMLRRLKRNVLSQLPPKRRQVIRLPKPPPSEWPKLAPGRRQHAGDSDSSASSGEEQDEAAEGAGAGGDGSGGAGAGRPQYTSAAHRTGVAKCSAVIEWLMTALGVRGGLQGGGRRRGAGAGGDDDDGASGDGGASGGGASEGGPKLLVFAHHKTVMNRLAAALEGAVGYAPVGYVRIDGGTDPEDRRAAVRRFSSDAAIRVALLSVAAAGVGLDFSAASVVVFAELPDEVALVRQAEDRAHRQGQRHPVNIYFLCAKGTTDDRRWQALNRSLARVSAVQDGAGLQAPPAGPAAGQGAGQAGEAGGVGDAGAWRHAAAADGSAPLRLNLPLETLLAGDSPALEELLAAVDQGAEAAPPAQQQQQQHTEPDGQQQQQQQLAAQQQQDIQRRLAGGGAEQPPPPTQHQQAQKLQTARPVVIGGIGVLAVDRQRSAGQLAVMLAEAKEFAAEWRELRGLHQSRLQGRVLRAPLNEAVEEADAAAAAGGQLGTSKSRFVDAQQRADLALPPRAQWHAVRVAFKRYGRETTYQQPFLPDGARLCINCAKAVPGKAAAQPPEALLDGMTLLFCGGECERRFGLKSNGSAYRRAVFKLERGVCVACKLDCHKLVKRLQAVEKGSRGWEEQRRRIIAARAPRLMARGYKAYLDVLVRRAVEGNAWQADHVVPVYKGGGLCDVDNLRTLCVACHADVTKEQAKERAATKRQGKAGGGGGGPGWEDVEAAGAGQPVLKRRKKLQRMYISDSEDGEAWPAPAAAAAPAAGAAAAAGAVAGAAAGAAAAGKPAMKRRKQLQRMLVERLAGEGYTIVAPKAEHPLPFAVPGLPRPGCPDTYLVPTAGLLSTFLSALDAAKALPAMQAANTSELVLLGHSAGGTTALLVAAGCPSEQDDPISCAGYQPLTQTQLRGVVVYEGFDEEPLLLDPSLFVMYMAGADSSAATLEFMQEAYLNTTTSADVAAAAANATLSGLDGPADDGALPAPPPAGEAAPLTAAVGAAAAPASEAALPAEPAEPGVEAADEAALLALPPVPEPATAAAAAPLAASPAQEAAAPAAETSPLNATTLDITALTPEQRGCVAYVVLSEANHFGITDYWVGNATEGQAAPCARVLPSSPPYLPSQETQAGTIDLAAALTSAAIQAALGDAAAAQTLAALAAEPGVAAARLPLCMSPP